MSVKREFPPTSKESRAATGLLKQEAKGDRLADRLPRSDLSRFADLHVTKAETFVSAILDIAFVFDLLHRDHGHSTIGAFRSGRAILELGCHGVHSGCLPGLSTYRAPRRSNPQVSAAPISEAAGARWLAPVRYGHT